jgi:hypothetical protein
MFQTSYAQLAERGGTNFRDESTGSYDQGQVGPEIVPILNPSRRGGNSGHPHGEKTGLQELLEA